MRFAIPVPTIADMKSRLSPAPVADPPHAPIPGGSDGLCS